MGAIKINPQMTNPSKMYPSMKGYFDFRDLEFDVTEGNGGFVNVITLKNDELLIYNENPRVYDSSKNFLANEILKELLPDDFKDLEIFGNCVIISKDLVRR